MAADMHCAIYILIFVSVTDMINGECEGCTAGGVQSNNDCYNIKAPNVYACPGTFTQSGGLNSAEAKAICNTGYEICPSAARTSELGLTIQDCGNIPYFNKFFASLESSSGSADCTTSGTNDIWGCADMEPLTNGQEVLVHCDSASCAGDDFAQCGNSLMAFLSGESLNSNDWSTGAWSFSSNADEINTVKLSNSAYGGVLCCVMPTDDPTSNPTETPTLSPSRYPTKTPTSNPSNNPTIAPTKNPTISPTMNPSTTPSTMPTISPTTEGEAQSLIYNFTIIVENDTITDVFIENIRIFLNKSFQSIFDSYDSSYTVTVTENESNDGRLTVNLASTSDDASVRKEIHDKTRSGEFSDELDKNVDEYNKEKGTHYVVRIDLGNNPTGDTESDALSSKTVMIIVVVLIVSIAWILICLLIIYRKRKTQLNLKRTQSEVIADEEIDEPGYKEDMNDSDKEKESGTNDTENNTDSDSNKNENNGAIIMKHKSEGKVQLAEIPKDTTTTGNDMREHSSSGSNSSMYNGTRNTTRTNGGDSIATMATQETVTTKGSVGIV